MQIVYALTNVLSFDRAWVKIGMTTRHAERRAAELSRTSVPFPFDLHMAFEVEDASAAEDILHRRFRPKRVSPHREFFDVDLAEVRAAMEALGGVDVTEQVFIDPSLIPNEPLDWKLKSKVMTLRREPEGGSEELSEGTWPARRKAGRYFLMGLRKGDVIRSKEFPSETAVIQTNRKVSFDGSRPVFLASATRSLLRKRAPGSSSRAIETAGRKSFTLWTFGSETLWEIYDRTYDDEAYEGGE